MRCLGAFFLLAVLMSCELTATKPPGALECIDRCLPDGVHLDRCCYEACTANSP